MLPTTFRRQQSWDPLDLIGQEFNRALTQWWDRGHEMNLTGMYPVDIREDDNHIYVEAEMPGFKNDEVKITLEDGVLTISAVRKTEGGNGKAQGQQAQGKGQAQQHLTERRFTRVHRAFTLPNRVDENAVDAKMDHGVLYVTLNKREEVKPRRIEVK